MAQLAIKGHATRGKEVIEILEMLGGKNSYNVDAIKDYCVYFIEDEIIFTRKVKQIRPNQFTIFTLEGFLEKFHYKVGDKVSSKYLKNYEVSKMEWESVNNRVIYKLQGMGWYSADELQPYKEETMDKANKAVFDANAQCCDIMNHIIKEKAMEEIKIDIPKGYEFAGVDDDNQQVVFERIGCQYPKTHLECCDVLGRTLPINDDVEGYKWELIMNFQRLLVCRDAYWKIAGDWKPEFRFGKKKYCIMTKDNKVISATVEETNRILAFPTEEMRDAFYENFKDLIEQCKELL